MLFGFCLSGSADSNPMKAAEKPRTGKRLASFNSMSNDSHRRNFAVLIVEDEPLLRMGACALIEGAGFKVYEAQSADEAVQLLEAKR